MAKGYIALKVDWEYQIERLQNALYQLFGANEDWTWIDPWLYHLTLAYADDVSNEQLLTAVAGAVGSEVVRLHFVGIGTFDTPDGKAVYLKTEANDALAALQKTIAGALSAQGVTLSPFSDPATWVGHLTLAYAPAEAVVPESVLDLDSYANTVCVSRSDYETVLELPLKWSIPSPVTEDGSGPLAEMSPASWKVGANADMPMMEGDPAWDGAMAKKGMFDACDMGGDAPDLSKVRKGFLLYNSSAPRLKGSYKLPIAQMVDGKMMVNPAGLRAAASRLMKVKGVPQAMLDKAGKMLAGYEKKAGIGEMQTIHMTYISEMAGKYPDVPLPGDIDKTALGEGAFFVTLPIGQVGALSGNGRNYKRSAVEELVTQVNQFRPEGIWGHMTDTELATRYDRPSIRWLSAMLDSEGVAWGKALPLDEATREYYRLAKATNARVGTSLTALAEMNGSDVEHIDLKSIDIADPTRVGVPITAAAPQLSREMGDVIVRSKTAVSAAHAGTPVPQLETKGKPMLTEEQINELTSAHDALKTQVAELVGERDALKARSEALVAEQTEHLKEIGLLLGEYIDKAIHELVAVEANRPVIAELVRLEQPQNRDAVKAALAAVLDRPYIVTLNKAGVAEQMGPKQTVTDTHGGDKQTPEEKYLNPLPKITIPPLSAKED